MTFPSNSLAPATSQVIGQKGLLAPGWVEPRSRLSYSVKRAEQRTSKPHGQTQQEARRLSDLVHFMRGKGLGENIWWATVGDLILDLDTQAARAAFDRFLRRLVELQRRANLPAYWISVFETKNGMHLNVIFVGTEAIADALRRSFPDFLRRKKAVQWADNLPGLVEYLSKELTQQAAAARLKIRRGMGKFPLDGGGDRVRPSRDLKRDALDVNAIEPWQGTNARRKPAALDKRIYKLAAVSLPEPEPIVVPTTPNALTPPAQLPLPFVLPKVSERLKDHRGGIMTPLAAYELEARRRRVGLTQRELGKLAGISQPQIANALCGRRAFSRQASSRVLDVLTAQERFAA